MELNMSSSESAKVCVPKPDYASVARTEEDVEPSLTFHQICYEASVRCGKRRKVILDSCSGIMRPGLNAIMGPTASGKTTLLDIMADRKGKKGVAGTVLVNGKRRPKNFKCISGYVVQDDLMMGMLTVRENLQFSAALRLPSHMTRKQRRVRVERVIEELDLQSCASTKVGTELIRGVSGGERKRTSIGMELIIEPPVLFLDEPTTGLDAHTAVSVIELLQQLSSTAGKIVILSIHQPRYSIFKMFDTLTLLSNGQVVFQGPAQQALPYFDTMGFKCGKYENPADFFLDKLIMCEKAALTEGNIVQANTDTGALLVPESTNATPVPLNHGKGTNMLDNYQQSNLYKENNKQLQNTMDALLEREHRGEEGRVKTAAYATNFLWQMCVVAIRSAVSIVKNPLSFFFLFLVLIILSLLVGLVYFQLGKKTITKSNLTNVINDRVGAFFFMTMNLIFTNMPSVELFIKQKAIFIHENASGYYRVSAFFFAQVLTDLILKRIIPVCVYSLIAYFMIALQPVASKFFIYLLTLFMVSVTSASIMYTYSSMTSVTVLALLLSALTFVLSMLFGGFFIALDSLPIWLQWIKYLSLFRYALEALSINEIAGEFYGHFSNSTNSTMSCHLPTCVDGTQALIDRGFETSAVWIWYDQLALLAMTVIALVITFTCLLTVKKHK